jgi:hypothetical protein
MEAVSGQRRANHRHRQAVADVVHMAGSCEGAALNQRAALVLAGYKSWDSPGPESFLL